MNMSIFVDYVSKEIKADIIRENFKPLKIRPVNLHSMWTLTQQIKAKQKRRACWQYTPETSSSLISKTKDLLRILSLN